MDPHADKTEEEIQEMLAAEHVRGPRTFHGRELSPMRRGLRDIWIKTMRDADTGRFADVLLLYILAEANGSTKDERAARRAALIRASDDCDTFRASASLFMDELSEEELVESRELTNEILSIIEKAETSIAEKKSGDNAEVQTLTVTPFGGGQ